MKIATINANGSTDCGLRILARINLSDAVKVRLTRRDTRYEGGQVVMTIYFANSDEISIFEAFGMGYGGTGPCGTVEVLTKLGVPKETAEEVFEYHGGELEFDIPQK
jgi:hypothetical protein